MAPTYPATGLAATAVLLLLLAAPAAAFNITKILSNYPDFANFNSLLNQTGIAKKINYRTTITVLAVDNGAAGALSNQSPAVLEHILSVHVILDYYDSKKLSKLSKGSAIVTTLFQSSGIAVNRTGFLNATNLKNGQVGFGSAVPGAGLTANLVKEVFTQPYNISILQVSSVIYPPGLDGMVDPPPSPPPPPAVAAPAPAPANAHKVLAPAPSKAHKVLAPTPAEAPDASSPDADAPTADAPATDAPSPGPSPAAADSEASAADGEAPDAAHTSSSPAVMVGAGLAVVAMGAAFLVAL